MINQSPAQYASAISSKVQNPFANSEFRSIQKFRAIVTDNKYQGDGNKIRVTPTTMTPLMRGHLTNNPLPMQRVYTDAIGRVITSKGTHNNNIIATYFSTDTYRKSPPDVQRGEHVWIWQNGDKTVWYWEPFNQDLTTSRRLETVVQAINADKPDGKDNKEYNEENTYYIENSSHNKTFTISTSAKNGEITTYLIQINAGKGSILIRDGLNNFFEINSKDTIIWMKNACGTMYKMDKNNIDIFCNGDFTAKVGQNMSIQVGGNLDTKVEGNVGIQIGGNLDTKVDGNISTKAGGNLDTKIEGNVGAKAGGNYTVEIGGTFSQKSSKNTFDCPVTEFTGSVKIAKGLSVTGMSEMGGGGVTKGSMRVEGTLYSSGPVDFPAGGDINGYRRW